MNNKLVEEAPYHPGYEDVGFKNKMNNEPVAWMHPDGKFNKKETWFFNIPLYTHPVKELTDEQITEVITKIANNNEYVYSLYKDFSEVEFSKVGIFEFARAILRKAQEK